MKAGTFLFIQNQFMECVRRNDAPLRHLVIEFYAEMKRHDEKFRQEASFAAVRLTPHLAARQKEKLSGRNFS